MSPRGPSRYVCVGCGDERDGHTLPYGWVRLVVFADPSGHGAKRLGSLLGCTAAHAAAGLDELLADRVKLP